MKALVYHGPGRKSWEEVTKPMIVEDTDAIVRIDASCITACGACRFCREGHYGQCPGGGGWILGHLSNGTQADYVRVPLADTSTYQVPAGASDEQILMPADLLPTGHEVGVLNGKVQPGDVVARAADTGALKVVLTRA